VCTLEQWCNELAAIPLQHHPGDDWLYGYGHDVIGRIIEVGQPIRSWFGKLVISCHFMISCHFQKLWTIHPPFIHHFSTIRW